MFNWFKKKSNKNQIIINIDENIFKDKKILCFCDLYQKLGINDYITQMTRANQFGKWHYKNIQANYETCQKLDKLIRNNLVETKNRYSKLYAKKILETMAAMDSLQCSPKISDDLIDDTIRIILPGDNNYTDVTKEMISYGQ